MKRLKSYLPTIIAVILSVTLVYVLPLPLDWIAKSLVVLTTFFVVYSLSALFTGNSGGNQS